MKKLTAYVISFCVGIFVSGCYSSYELDNNTLTSNELVIFTDEEQPETEPEPETESVNESESETDLETAPETEPETESETEPETEVLSSVEWGQSYTTPEDVAEYIHIYSELPPNFITKNEAKKLGWESSKGNLWDVAPNMSIGGDTFGNREGLLPDGKYYECDVNYSGGYRGSERLIFSNDGRIYYTNDHYQTFEQLY